MDKRLKLLNTLHSFESAARHCSYTKAAEELFVSQAAVSQQMRLLETTLKAKLFIRSGRNMLLTQAGQKLLDACQKGFEEIIKGLNAIQCEGVAGDLTITSTQAFCSMWLMPRLFRFSLLHPEINIKILGSNQVEDLHKKHIDLAIRFSTRANVFEDKRHVVKNFGEDYVYPVCSPALVENGTLKKPEDLLNCRLISLANERIVTWKEWFDNLGIQENINDISKTEVTSSDMALSAVISGHGVALAATAMFKPYIHSKQLVIPFNIKHPVHWNRYLVYSVNTSRQSRIEVFMNWIQQEMEMERDKNNI